MTTDTIASHTTVIKRGGSPVVGIMAIITLVTAGDMIGTFTSSNCAVVAGDTGT